MFIKNNFYAYLLYLKKIFFFLKVRYQNYKNLQKGIITI